MTVTEKEIQAWCETLLAGRSAAPDQTLSDYIRAIPGIASLMETTMMSPSPAYFRREPPSTLMHLTTRAPELSATSRWVVT